MKRLIAIALMGTLTPQLLPPANAQIPIPVAVGACYANPIACTVVIAVGGLWYITWKNQKTQACTSLQCVNTPQIIDNPDEVPETSSDYIWAKSKEDAQSSCRKMVERFGGKNARVDEGGSWTNQMGKRRFTCYWESN